MTDTKPLDLERYRRARVDGLRARDAIRYARAAPDLPDWPRFEDSMTVERGGFTVHVSAEPDAHADLSDLGLGHYSDKWAPGALDLFHGEGNRYARTYRYFHPDCSLSDVESGRRFLSARGYAKHEAWTMANGHRHEQLRMAEAIDSGDAGVFLVRARVVKAGVTLAESAMGGGLALWRTPAEADSAEEYRADLAGDVIAEAVAEAEAALEDLRAA